MRKTKIPNEPSHLGMEIKVIAVTKGLLFPNVGHKCLMAKDGKRKKVKSKSSTKYASSSDEDHSSDEEDNLRTLFANLNMEQKKNWWCGGAVLLLWANTFFPFGMNHQKRILG
jgi:hypothetical protein